MKKLPSRLRRLDDALADLPLDEPMLLSELDGFLTGVLLCPDAIPQHEWMTVVWGSDEGGVAPFDDPLDVRWFADAVCARQSEIARDLARGKPQPIFDVDERNGDVMWEVWVDGYAQAMALRPDDWVALSTEDAVAAKPLARMALLIEIAEGESALDSMEINALQDEAPGMVIDLVRELQGARVRRGEALPGVAAGASPAKVGRNEPCPCGSGRKSKRCCA